jgi:hypothetical protein
MAQTAPRGVLGGSILIAVGVVYLLQAVGFPHPGSALFVALGLAFTTAYLAGPRPYVYLVPAGVLLGFGLGLLAPPILGVREPMSALIFFMFLGAGLMGVFVVAPERRWPLVPAAILAAFALLVASGRQDIIPGEAQIYLVPLILVAVGAYLLAEQRKGA